MTSPEARAEVAARLDAMYEEGVRHQQDRRRSLETFELPEAEELTFRPELCITSYLITRELDQQSGGHLSVAERAEVLERRRQARLAEMRAQKAAEDERALMKECTFQPNTTRLNVHMMDDGREATAAVHGVDKHLKRQRKAQKWKRDADRRLHEHGKKFTGRPTEPSPFPFVRREEARERERREAERERERRERREEAAKHAGNWKFHKKRAMSLFNRAKTPPPPASGQRHTVHVSGPARPHSARPSGSRRSRSAAAGGGGGGGGKKKVPVHRRKGSAVRAAPKSRLRAGARKHSRAASTASPGSDEAADAEQRWRFALDAVDGAGGGWDSLLADASSCGGDEENNDQDDGELAEAWHDWLPFGAAEDAEKRRSGGGADVHDVLGELRGERSSLRVPSYADDEGDWSDSESDATGGGDAAAAAAAATADDESDGLDLCDPDAEAPAAAAGAGADGAAAGEAEAKANRRRSAVRVPSLRLLLDESRKSTSKLLPLAAPQQAPAVVAAALEMSSAHDASDDATSIDQMTDSDSDGLSLVDPDSFGLSAPAVPAAAARDAHDTDSDDGAP